MGKNTHKSQMESEPSRDSSGSVLEPMSSGTDVYGGWSESNGGNTAAKLLGIAIPTAIGIALLARKRGRLKEQFEEAA